MSLRYSSSILKWKKKKRGKRKGGGRCPWRSSSLGFLLTPFSFREGKGEEGVFDDSIATIKGRRRESPFRVPCVVDVPFVQILDPVQKGEGKGRGGRGRGGERSMGQRGGVRAAAVGKKREGGRERGDKSASPRSCFSFLSLSISEEREGKKGEGENFHPALSRFTGEKRRKERGKKEEGMRESRSGRRPRRPLAARLAPVQKEGKRLGGPPQAWRLCPSSITLAIEEEKGRREGGKGTRRPAFRRRSFPYASPGNPVQKKKEKKEKRERGVQRASF